MVNKFILWNGHNDDMSDSDSWLEASVCAIVKFLLKKKVLVEGPNYQCHCTYIETKGSIVGCEHMWPVRILSDHLKMQLEAVLYFI